MKYSLARTAAALTGSAILTLLAIAPAKAFTFDETEINQERVVAIAQPRPFGGYQLLIVEQVTDKRQCWSENGSNPVRVDPLLVNFDFTGICGRATDSNGFSIRMGGTDLALKYSLSLEKIDGNVVLMGTSLDPNVKPIIIGRTNGDVNGFMKITLDPGWRFSKRAYQGKVLGHFYFTTSQNAPGETGNTGGNNGGNTGGNTGGNNGGNTGGNNGGNNGGNTGSATFKDIAADIYAAEIKEAVALGFVAGFPQDNTFRPQLAVTREQLVSLVLESLKGIQGVNITFPSNVSTRPYSDVDSSRWSAGKILFARDNKIVSGYTDGTFKPTQPVTRAELMAVLRRAAEFGLLARGMQPNLLAKEPPKTFSDIQNHWAAAIINQMSGYCGVASSVNEIGNRFTPDDSAKRNYAAAATLRMLKCVKA
ncbi:DUF3747 domain-containing protein [Tychonema sp. LEGE 07203]|uniref:DUF3747 domain-containing protein n=1 Tax=Tychonema sp. LEGE 07203 TaxID=1828671 RepID=UPI00187FFBBE|nr:DUF3747 domain-containing protein [Tychonema sp. LEGE 07203]MBE9095966.1 DUF3747 domain-containing protein [Tychonema sp. LEGE 07203]